MRKSTIQITQWEAHEIARMLMNYGLILEVLNGTRGIPSEISDFIEKRRAVDFKKVDVRMNRLMVKMLSAMNVDHDKRFGRSGSDANATTTTP